MGSRWTLVRVEYREMRAVPVSTTYLMPGTVSEVSATLVASTIRRLPPVLKTRFCSCRESRPKSGRISEPASLRSRETTSCRWSAASRISRSPGKKTRMSPSGSWASSATASATPSRRSFSSSVWAGPRRRRTRPRRPGAGVGPQRPVADLHREGSAGDLDDGNIGGKLRLRILRGRLGGGELGEVSGKALRVDGGRGDDHLQVRAAGQQAPEVARMTSMFRDRSWASSMMIAE